MATLDFDERAARHIQRVYATPDVVAQRLRVLELLDPRPGERVLDVGSGPGFLLDAIADRTGPQGRVHGLDPAPAMHAIAAEVTGGRATVRLDEGDAAALPYAGDTFDAAVSTQVYEYVADLPRAFAELCRVVRPGGRVVLLDTDWDSVVWHAADPARHRRVMAAWDGHLVHPHLPRTLPGLLRRAGFRVTGRHLVPIFNPEYDPDTYSALTIDTIAAYVAGRDGLTGADVDAWAADLRDRGEDYLFSLNRYCFVAERGS
ncbi:methyltransferase domain-containing protein [Pseudonocardia parietis]|uniref:SAM-dependent methyltransferase n=1 Tax=Pseudonocardia parietis TaxID=570936 RepID=A0ABS4W2Z4_9PSEU|nr:methyltransferase domain-containing protein [Pseudonocardia parietis]MBP2370488.1 SAM-dependent methyltransferase [Pseudonocardia parietis]